MPALPPDKKIAMKNYSQFAMMAGQLAATVVLQVGCIAGCGDALAPFILRLSQA